MTGIDDPTGAQDDDGGPGRLQRRRTWFVSGTVLGLALGVAVTLVVPDLFPEDPPDCVRPERVVWSQEGTGVQVDITYADDATNGCTATVVFREPAEATAG